MRRRNIKSVAHWVVMCFILLFPIVMVGISSFSQPQQEISVTETYQYQTNEVNTISDLVVGNIYKIEYDAVYDTSETLIAIFGDTHTDNYQVIKYDTDAYVQATGYQSTKMDYFVIYTHFTSKTLGRYSRLYYGDNADDNLNIGFYGLLSTQDTYHVKFYVVFDILPTNDNLLTVLTASDYLGEKTIDYSITDETMREDVNQWCASFRNLPVNQWYDNLLSAIGLGITTSMMMNVIYTYPLYVLWVYILDLVVDIFLVIINFGHNALKRLGGDNE